MALSSSAPAFASSSVDDDVEMTSADHRREHTFFATAGLGLFNGSYAAGAYFMDNFSVELDVGVEFNSFASSTERTYTLGQAKYYLENSFYVALGYGELRICRECDDPTAAETTRHGYADVAIGNQWIFDNHITLGAEWVGFPVSVPTYNPAKQPLWRLAQLTVGLSF